MIMSSTTTAKKSKIHQNHFDTSKVLPLVAWTFFFRLRCPALLLLMAASLALRPQPDQDQVIAPKQDAAGRRLFG